MIWISGNSLDMLPAPVAFQTKSMRILSISTDQELLMFRQSALVAAGYQVTSMGSEKEVLAACSDGVPHDAILLCHRLPSGVARQMVRLLRQSSPGTKIVYIAHVYGEWPDVEADRYLVGADGPEALLRVLSEVKASAA